MMPSWRGSNSLPFACLETGGTQSLSHSLSRLALGDCSHAVVHIVRARRFGASRSSALTLVWVLPSCR